MKVKRTEYWTIYDSCGGHTVCSMHKTAGAAWRTAARCEKDGSGAHEIVEVNYLEQPEKKQPKRSKKPCGKN